MAAITWKSIRTEDYATRLEKSKVDLYIRFIEANNIVGWSVYGCESEDVAHTLHKKRGHMKRTRRYADLWFDHSRIYKLANNDRVYVCHPYLGDKVEEYKEVLGRWAEENGLVATVYDPTYDWYYHSNDSTDFNATSLVIAHMPGVEIQVAQLIE